MRNGILNKTKQKVDFKDIELDANYEEGEVNFFENNYNQ